MNRTDIAILVAAATVVTIAALAGNAAAAVERASCIDPRTSYVARALNTNEIFVQNTLGTHKPPIRVTTSCRHLQSANGFGFSTTFKCISQGDTVVATIFDEHQTCIVTRVAPYAVQKNDIPEESKEKEDKKK